MTIYTRSALILFTLLIFMLTAACREGSNTSNPSGGRTDSELVIGFSQVGSESRWREANTRSIQEAARQRGITLHFSNAEQRQSNQLRAIRSYISQKVDVIAFSPVIESGWDQVLLEAQAAGIPVVLTDRSINSSDTSLYVTLLGSDFVEEGRKAGRWLLDHYRGREEPVNIVELQGTIHSAPAIDRKKGFEESIADNRLMKVIQSESGDFTREQGKAAMISILATAHLAKTKIDVLYSHNDDMAMGAIEAIEEAGLIPGKDIVILSVDGTQEALQALIDGKLNVVIECNPLLGPQLMQVAEDIAAGKTLPKRIVTAEGVFTKETASKEIHNREY